MGKVVVVHLLESGSVSNSRMISHGYDNKNTAEHSTDRPVFSLFRFLAAPVLEAMALD